MLKVYPLFSSLFLSVEYSCSINSLMPLCRIFRCNNISYILLFTICHLQFPHLTKLSGPVPPEKLGSWKLRHLKKIHLRHVFTKCWLNTESIELFGPVPLPIQRCISRNNILSHWHVARPRCAAPPRHILRTLCGVTLGEIIDTNKSETLFDVFAIFLVAFPVNMMLFKYSFFSLVEHCV